MSDPKTMIGLDQDIRHAVKLHNAGQLGEAEEIYRRILAIDPANPDAMHLLGLVAMQMGQPAAAQSLIRNAIQARPEFPAAISNLAQLLSNEKNFPQAVELYQKLVTLKPADANAWYSLAINLRSASRFTEALDAAQHACDLNPQFPQAHLEIGDLHRTLKNPEKSAASCRRAIELDPRIANAHNSLGNALNDLQQYEQAVPAYQRAIELEPGNSSFHFNLGTVLSRMGRSEEALVALDTALTLNPDDALAHSVRGTTLSSLKRNDEAIQAHLRAVALLPDLAALHHAMGESYRIISDNTSAEAAFQRALQLDNNLAVSWIRLGEIHLISGSFDLAASEFTRALELDPKNTTAYQHLSTVGKLKSDSEVAHLRSLLDGGHLEIKEQINAGFALGKLLDERDQFDDAFARYHQANALFKQYMIGDTARFDRGKLKQSVDDKIDLFTTDFFQNRREWGIHTEIPVFVVGMPRSGTTLVEQIAATHPQVFGAGERTEIRAFADQLKHPTSWSHQAIQEIAKQHLDRLTNLGPGAARVIDKMPGNIMQLGLIATLFPKAKVIVCQRNPVDNCLSCFFQRFSKNNLAFSYDLLDCAAQLLEQNRLLDHWKKVLPNPLLEMHYEQMVADQETQSRRLIQFLDLPWDPACLEFYKTQRTVITASVWQVRQPIYTGSVGRWKQYETHLADLIKALHS